MIIQNKIFVWNVRGAANTELYSNAKQFLDVHHPDILVIMETRIDPNCLKRTFQLLGYDSMCCSAVRGFAGGILVAWRNNCLQVDILDIKFQFIHLKVAAQNTQPWYFTAVYASPHDDHVGRSEMYY